MTWIEGILDFLRNGPTGGKLDMNALFQGAVEMRLINREKAVREINSLIKWQTARKRWHADKTRQKMAQADANGNEGLGALASTFKPGDFGLNAMDLQDLDMADEDDDESESESEEDDDADPIEAERKRRKKRQDVLRRGAGEPVKPPIEECHKVMEQFLGMLRVVLASD